MSEERRKSQEIGDNFESLQHQEGKRSKDEENFGKFNILADTRRRYNAQDEFVYLLYNDIVQIFGKQWSKTSASSKSTLLSKFREDLSGANEGKIENRKSKSENEGIPEKDGKSLGLASSNWKLSLPDEYVEIEFPNKNIYTGRLSRREMEGNGTYRWGSGEIYKGEFEQNSIQGKGHIEWKDQSWYEGEFNKGHRHGIGTFVSHGYGRFYTGNWYMGRKHGNGYCRYGKNEDFYDGEWKMDKKDGNGYRVYENGTRYIGQWKDNQRNGIGTMVWSNGDVYRGEWENGTMNGYGDYIWNGFLNESLSWPQENSYMGEWVNGMRHGRGVLKLNSTGGAKYSGNWYLDEKHGYGMIVGNNGAVTEADPLFLNNILTPLQGTDSEIEINCEKELEEEGSISLHSKVKQKLIKHAEPRITTVFEPLQFPPLSYHIQRLLDPPKYSQKYSGATIKSGKCRLCRSNSSCECLYDLSGRKSTEAFDMKSSSTSRENSETELINSMMFEEKQYEKHWVHNCLQTHMKNLRKVYKLYAELYCSKKDIKCNLSMGKIALWQLMRDCKIDKKGISLVQFQRYIALNKSAFIDAVLNPFERIEFFQFIQSLLEVSWHLYTKLNDIETDFMRGRLAGGLHRLLVKDIFPNAGKVIGCLSKTYKDLLPIYSVYKLYCEIGEPHTAKTFLRATCTLKDTADPKPSISQITNKKLIPGKIINGINAITVGQKLSFIPSDEESMKSDYPELGKNYEDNLNAELLAFRHLGATKMLSIISSICPGVKDEETDMIVNMDYEITFLEFYEILIESTRMLIINMKKVSEAQELEANKISADNLTASESRVKSLTKSKSSIERKKFF